MDEQLEREVEQALRCRAMTPAEFAAWLKATWGELQARVAKTVPMDGEVTARCFTSFEEKNRYDEEREVAWAVQAYRQRRLKQ